MARHSPHGIAKMKFIRDFKLEKGCSVCGYNEIPEVLELDHIDRTKKNFKLSRAWVYSWDKVIAELENCVVMCSNCHRKKTIEEKDYRKTDYEEPEDLQYDLFGDKDED